MIQVHAAAPNIQTVLNCLYCRYILETIGLSVWQPIVIYFSLCSLEIVHRPTCLNSFHLLRPSMDGILRIRSCNYIPDTIHSVSPIISFLRVV